MWQEHYDAVLKEVKDILKMADPPQQQIFNMRLKAAAAVFSRLSPEQQADIERRTESGAKHVNPPDIQRK